MNLTSDKRNTKITFRKAKRRKGLSKNRISKTDLLVFASALIVSPLSGLQAVIHIINYVSLVIELIFLVVLLISIFRRKAPAVIFFPLIIYAYLFINTLIQNGDIVQAGSCLIREMGCFYVVVYWLLKGKKTELIFNFSRAFDLLLILNALHMLIAKDGFGFTRVHNHIFILASDNSLSFFIIVFVIVHELRNRIRPFGLIRNILYYAIIIFELIRGESATSLFVFVILFFGVLLARKLSINRFYFAGCGIVAFLNLFLIYIRKLSFIEPLFKTLGKDATLSGRMLIWDDAIRLINKSFLFGYGISDNMYYVRLSNMEMEAHNMLLSYMLQGGIVLLILMISLIFLCGRKVKRSRNIPARYEALGLLAYLFIFLVESPAFVYGFYFMVAFCLMEERDFGEKKSEIIERNF